MLRRKLRRRGRGTRRARPPRHRRLLAARSTEAARRSTLSTSATFRVWFPSAVDLVVSDVSLGMIVPHSDMDGAESRLERAVRLNATCSMRYQKAELRAYATFTLGDDSSVSVDVTSLVQCMDDSHGCKLVWRIVSTLRRRFSGLHLPEYCTASL